MSVEDTGSVNLDITATGSQFKAELDQSQVAVVKFVDAAVSRFDFLANAIRGVSKGPLAASLGDLQSIGTTLDEQIMRLNAALGIYQRTSAEYRAEVARVIEYVEAQGGAFSRAMLEAQGFDDRVVATLFHMREFAGAIGDATGDMYTLANAEREVADMAAGVVDAIEAEDKAVLRLAANVQRSLADQDVAVAKNVRIVQQAETDKVAAIESAQTKATTVVAEATAKRVALEEDAAAEVAAIQERAAGRAAELALSADAEAGLRGARGRSGAIRQGAMGGGMASRIAAQIEAETEMAGATRTSIEAKYDKLSQSELARSNAEIMRLERVKNNTLEAMGSQNSVKLERITREAETTKAKIVADGEAQIEEITRATQAKIATLNANAATADADAKKVMVSRVVSLEAQLQSQVAQIREAGTAKTTAIDAGAWREVNSIAQEYEQLSEGHIRSYETRLASIVESSGAVIEGIEAAKYRVLESAEAAHNDRMLSMQSRYQKASLEEARKTSREAEALRFGGRELVDSYSGIARFTRQFALARESGDTMMGAGTIGMAAVAGTVAASSSVTDQIYKVKGNTDMSRGDISEVKQGILGLKTDQAIDKEAAAFMRARNYGFQHADMLKVVSTANIGAIATTGNLDVIAKELARTLYNFKIPVGDSTKVLNALEAAAAKNDMTMEEFVEHSGRAFEAAAAMNIPFTEAAAILGTLTKAGMSAAQSQTALRSIIKGIVDPSKESAKWIAYLSQKTGIDLVKAFSASGLAENGLVHTFDLLNQATQGHIDLLTKVFSDQRSAIPIISLLTNNHAALRDTLNYENIQIERNNRIQDNAADRMKTIGYQVGALKHEVIVLASAYGDTLAPDVKKATEWIDRILDNFNKLSPEAKSAEVRTLAVGSAFVFLSGATLRVIATLPSIIDGWKSLKLLAFGVATNLKLIAPAAATAETAVEGVALAEGTAFALTPVGLFVTALAGVALGIYALKKAWDSANDAEDKYYRERHHGNKEPVPVPNSKDYRTYLGQKANYDQDAVDNYDALIERFKATPGLYVDPNTTKLNDIVTSDSSVKGALSGSDALSWLEDQKQKFVDDINKSHAESFGDDDLTNTRKNIANEIKRIVATKAAITKELNQINDKKDLNRGYLSTGVYAPGSRAEGLTKDYKTLSVAEATQEKNLRDLPKNSVGELIAVAAESMRSVAKHYKDLCERLVSDTVHKATGHYSVDGVNLKQNAIDVMYEAQRKNVGMPYSPGMQLYPGDILLTSQMGKRGKNTYGHAGTMLGNGMESDDMGVHSPDKFPWEWVLRAGAHSGLDAWARPGRFKVPASNDKLPTSPGGTSTGRGTEAIPNFKPLGGVDETAYRAIISGYIAADANKTAEKLAQSKVDINNYKEVLAAIKQVTEQRLADPNITPLQNITAQIDGARKLLEFYTNASRVLKSQAVADSATFGSISTQIDVVKSSGEKAEQAWLNARKAKKDFEEAHTGKLSESDRKELRALNEQVNELHNTYSMFVDSDRALHTSLVATATQIKENTNQAYQYSGALLQTAKSLDTLTQSRKKLELETPKGQLGELRNNSKAGFYTHESYQGKLRGLLGDIAGGAGLNDTEGVDPKIVLSRLEGGTGEMKAAVKDYQAVLNELDADIARTAKSTALHTKLMEGAFDTQLVEAIKTAGQQLKDGSIAWEDYSAVADAAAQRAALSAQSVLRSMDQSALTSSQKTLLDADVSGKSAKDLNGLIAGSGIAPMVKAWEQAYGQIQIATDKHAQAMKKASKEYYADWNEAAKMVSSSVNSELDSMLKKHVSFGRAASNIWARLKEDVTKKFLEDNTKKAFDWLGGRVKPHDTSQTDDTKKKADEILSTIKPITDETLAAQSALLSKTVAVSAQAQTAAAAAQATLVSAQQWLATALSFKGAGPPAASSSLPGSGPGGAQGGTNPLTMTTTQLAQWLGGSSTGKQFSQVGGSVASLTTNLQSLAKIAPGKGFMDAKSKSVNVGEVGQLGSDVASAATGGSVVNAGADALGTLKSMGAFTKMGGLGASMSAALPWVGAAIAVANIFDVLGHQSKPDVVQKIGETKYNALTGTDFSGIAKNTLSGADGMRALMGGYGSQQAAQAALAKSGGDRILHMAPGAIVVTLQGVDPSNAKQVADLVYSHINDKLTTDATIHNATTGMG